MKKTTAFQFRTGDMFNNTLSSLTYMFISVKDNIVQFKDCRSGKVFTTSVKTFNYFL